MEKTFNQKIFMISFGHLWVVELAFREIFLRFILNCQQFDNLPPVSLTPVANLPPVSTTLVKLVEKFAAGVVATGSLP